MTTLKSTRKPQRTGRFERELVTIGDMVGFKLSGGSEHCRTVKDLKPGQALVAGLNEGEQDWWVSLEICWKE